MQIYSKNVDITEPLRVYIEEKLGNLSKFQQQVVSVRADLSRDQHHKKGDVFRFEVNVTIPNKLLRVVETKPDAREAIDAVAKKLIRQMRQTKEKRLSARRLGKLFRFGRK